MHVRDVKKTKKMDARDKTQCRKKQLDFGRRVTGTSSIERSPLGRLYGNVPYFQTQNRKIKNY
jgi:hypothetical protein